MADEHTNLRLSVSGGSEPKLDDKSASDIISTTAHSQDTLNAATPTHLEQNKLGEANREHRDVDLLQVEDLHVEPTDTKVTGGNRIQMDIQSCIIHAPDILQPISELVSTTKKDDDRRYSWLNKATGMSERLGIYYQIIPPGYRTACPHAHSKEDELVFCLQGRGTIWQNGWIYPFEPGDVVGWTGGTGITHCVINDTKPVPGQSNGDEEDLILLVVGENKPGEDELHYPHNPERYEAKEVLRWENVTLQNEGGAHPGVARAERPNDTLPGYQLGARPSNIVNWRDQLAPAGEGELFAYATSLSQETGLSGRFGCNLEVIPPGARSSDPHAHSVEDELVFVIQGEGLVWLDGYTFPVSSGDAIGFRGGTGLAHTIINDSDAHGEESSQDLVLWIVGENRRSEDRVVYPMHPEKSGTFPRWWQDAPARKLGDVLGYDQHLPHSTSNFQRSIANGWPCTDSNNRRVKSTLYIMSAPSGTTAGPASNPGAHLAGAKALLAKKLAQKENAAAVSSPTDNMMTPTTAKINAVKKKHFTKGKPLSGPRFGTALATQPAPQKLEAEEEIVNSDEDISKAPEP
ncbi:Cupin domain [Rhizoctonia solani]|uniref:Cupin domain n=1 Tax=Rhizoctonia solani TaxID=456999 RepID=A0A8H7LKG8_9AGAM|nr:Cupin domain [Rhizoctonia solani]